MWTRRKTWEGSLRNYQEVPGRESSKGWHVGRWDIQVESRQTSDAPPRDGGHSEPEALGAFRCSVPKGWCPGARPSVASGGTSCALPGPLFRPPVPRPCPLLPEAAPSPSHLCIWHCPLAPGTALPQASTTPTAGEGRGKPRPGPHRLWALTTQNLTGEAEKKTRSCDQSRDPRGTGTTGKPGADYPSGSACCYPLLAIAPLILQ